jgi:hypothetical protein
MRAHVIVRKRDVHKFIPYAHTQLDALIEKGLLKTVPLSPGGRARGVTMESIIKYQRDHMGLEPLPDDTPHDAQAIHDREPAPVDATPSKH